METELQRLRELATAISQKRKRGADGGGKSLQELATDGLLHILDLKDANKRLCARVEAAREATTVTKLSLESSDSALQNLLYERGYYEKEILACRSFVSKVKDEAVALMPEEQFWAAVQGSNATPEDQDLAALAAQSPHELMKARLVHEQRLRQQLVKKLDELKQQKEGKQEASSAQQKVLNDLQARLKSVEAQAKPLQTVLGQAIPLKPSMSRAAELLPTPLYVAYSQLVAAGQAMHIGCNASIVGSGDEAEGFAQQLAQQLEGGEEQPAAKPTSLDEMYKTHPLSVELHILKESGAATTAAINSQAAAVTLKPPIVLMIVVLQYLPALKVVTAHCKDPQDTPLLQALFPGDDGTTAPPEALSQLQAGSFRYSAQRPARPYRWCQYLAGLDFVLTLPQLALQLQPGEQVEAVLAGLEQYRRQQRAACVVQRLRQLKVNEHALK